MEVGPFISSSLAMTVLFLTTTTQFMVDGSHLSTENEDHNIIMIGAIVDKKSRMGMEQIVAMETALEDFNEINNQSFVLHIRDSHSDPLQAFLAAQELAGIKAVKAIVGPQTWEETSLVAEVGTNNKIPILTFADSTPKWAIKKWPFLLQVSPNKNAQMKAIAAMVQSWEWHQVTVIYEDSDSSALRIFPHLSESLHELGIRISHTLALPPVLSSLSWTEHLEELKSTQCRVFVVHLSFQSAMRFFLMAKRMKMMEKGYVWIATDGFTSLVHSINASIISSIEGVLGVKGYYPENGQKYHGFYDKFLTRFSLKYPDKRKHEPGIFAMQAYDAIWVLALAMIRESNRSLLENIIGTDYDGLSGNFGFKGQSLAPMDTFQIINLVGKSYRELGFWTLHRNGFSFSSNRSNVVYNSSMKDLGQVFWPGGPLSAPRGWTLRTSEKPLKIGVPTESTFKQYVIVECDDEQCNHILFRGYAIDLFRATVAELPFHLEYEFTPFNGSYTELMKQIHFKKFDAAVGDIAIVASRLQYVDFTIPYTESELVMIVAVWSKTCDKAWLFMRPFTKEMWGLICTITIYNGFVIWLIERNHRSDLRGSILNQIGTLLWLSFTTLCSLQGSRLHSNLSRMTMVVWLFVALILTQTYTANLSSILTTKVLEPMVDSIELLQSSNAFVGHMNVSFVAKYLEEVLHFKHHNLKGYVTPEDVVNDLRNGEIGAVFLEKPTAKIFLSKYCKGYTMAGPSFKVGGYGFAFPKGSPLLSPVTKALVTVTEKGELKDLEKSMLASIKCVKGEKLDLSKFDDNDNDNNDDDDDDDDDDDEASSLSIDSFWMLFILSGGTSTIALLVYATSYIRCRNKDQQYSSYLLSLWTLMFNVITLWRQHRMRQQLSRRVSDADQTTLSPVSNLSIQVLT